MNLCAHCRSLPLVRLPVFERLCLGLKETLFLCVHGLHACSEAGMQDACPISSISDIHLHPRACKGSVAHPRSLTRVSPLASHEVLQLATVCEGKPSMTTTVACPQYGCFESFKL